MNPSVNPFSNPLRKGSINLPPTPSPTPTPSTSSKSKLRSFVASGFRMVAKSKNHRGQTVTILALKAPTC